jgi:hypothetical protein
MGDKLKPEDKQPPSKRTVDLIHRRVSNRWPGVHVEVVYAWSTGTMRLYFKWPYTKGIAGKHERVGALRSTDRRVVCLMTYRQLIDEIGTLDCAVCSGEGSVPCKPCKGTGKTKAGRVCARCDGRAMRTCAACSRRLK